MRIIEYNRVKVLEYAKVWAYKRNPNYYDFSAIGGDCTNFASQCLYAGCNQMNYVKTYGWYYINVDNRSPSFTSVNYFYNFLIQNGKDKIGSGIGPFGGEIDLERARVGDFIQLGKNNKGYYHTLVVVDTSNEGIKTASHSFDSFNRSLFSYNFDFLRVIGIDGVRVPI